MATKSTNSTIWTVAIIAILAFLVWKLWPTLKNALKGSSSTSGGGSGVGASYYPPYSNPYSSQPQGSGGFSLGASGMGSSHVPNAKEDSAALSNTSNTTSDSDFVGPQGYWLNPATGLYENVNGPSVFDPDQLAADSFLGTPDISGSSGSLSSMLNSIFTPSITPPPFTQGSAGYIGNEGLNPDVYVPDYSLGISPSTSSVDAIPGTGITSFTGDLVSPGPDAAGLVADFAGGADALSGDSGGDAGGGVGPASYNPSS
jgi:hypothetical protein